MVHVHEFEAAYIRFLVKHFSASKCMLYKHAAKLWKWYMYMSLRLRI